MKNYSLNIIIILASAFILSNCGDKAITDTDKQVQDTVSTTETFDFPQPDSYFFSAKEAFEANDYVKAQEGIAKAIEYIKTVRVERDYRHADLIINAIAQLDSISALIAQGKIDNSKDLSLTFAHVDQAIGAYHMFIVEEWLKSVDKNEASKIRMQRAIVRIENAVNHAGLQLNDEELKEYNKAKNNLRNGNNSVEEWWLKTKDNFYKLNARMDAGSNPLDGSM
jgi:soluble cytochrome b562